jgi:hypothetical protein
MPPSRNSIRCAAGLAAIVILGCACGAGCNMGGSARLWADTAQADGSFSLQLRQWAYDGEPVTFELECASAPGVYIVFGVAGDDTVVNTAKVEGRYRWTRVFHAGPKPQRFEVYAIPFVIRGKCDWIYDQNEDQWYHYPGGGEKPDVLIAPEQTIEITCYRLDIRVPFAGRGGPPKHVALSLTKADGARKEIPPVESLRVERPRPKIGAETLGFLLLGPNKAEGYEVTYVPRYDEVSRAGKTRVEVLVEHADGSVERLTQDLDTP